MGSIKERSSPQLLDLVFGSDSHGGKPEERATNSKRLFVRSQVQIAFASTEARGRVLSAYEALQTFGWDVLLRVAQDGAATLVRSANEPAETLKSQRTQLGLSIAEVSKRIGVEASQIASAEEPGSLNSFRILDKLGQTLALDELRLGFQPNAGRDSALGVRLRELKQAADSVVFGPSTVLGLSEAAWVIARQAYLTKALRFRSQRGVALPGPNENYSSPVYSAGYSLAEYTRKLLGLNDEQPIDSLRTLIEEVLELPLVQQDLEPKFAGATISNGGSRGIVINERGMNSNVWVRRMTLCHEVGHLLWDSDARLAKLKVDEYSDVEGVVDPKADAVEVRANAFAVAFLAPLRGVLKIAEQCHGNALQTVSTVMSVYGISAATARHHVFNVTHIDTANLHASQLPTPSEDWVAQEDLSIGYFPIKTTPITRRGKFAWFVARSYADGKLSADSAASYLMCEKQEVVDHLQTILEMWPSADGVTRP